MKIKKLAEKVINKIKNINGCTNQGGIEVVGKKLYAIKTRSDNLLSTILYFPDYEKTTCKTHKYSNCMKHGNDLCYADGYLYVAPCDKYVEKVSVKTWKHQRISSNVRVSGIAHYKDNQFIVLRGQDTKKGTYKLSIVKEENGKFISIKNWEVNKPKDYENYTTSQGITFYKKNSRIYVIFSRKDLKSNIILRSAIDKIEPDYCFTSKTGKTKYEFEGISINSDGKKIISANINDGDSLFIS